MDVVKGNEWIVITNQSNSCCRLEFVNEQSDHLLFGRKISIPTKFLIGLPYGSCITIGPDGSWCRCSRISIDSMVERVLARLHELGVGCGDDESGGEDDEIDYAACKTGTRGGQKLSREEVMARKNEGMALFDLIVELCAGADSFQTRSIYSQEKYIRKKLGRHLLLLSVQKVTVRTAHQAYMGLGSGLKGENGNTGCSSKCSSWIPLETLSTLLNDADITAGRKVLVFDQFMGIMTSAIMARLLNEGNHLGSRLIFSSEMKGSSSFIMNQMNFDPKDLKLIYQEIPYLLLQAAVRADGDFNHESVKEVNPIFFGAPVVGNTSLNDAKIASLKNDELEKRGGGGEAAGLERLVEAQKARQVRIDQRMSCWSYLSNHQLDAVVAGLSNSSFQDNDVRFIANALGDIYSVALHALKPDGRLVIFNNAMQPLSDLFAFIKARSQTWCNCSFVEICHRRICTLPGRSHPQMDATIRFTHGFVLSATRMIQTETLPTPDPDYTIINPKPQTAKKIRVSAQKESGEAGGSE